MTKPSYDQFPHVAVPNSDGKCVAGWEGVANRIRKMISVQANTRVVMVVECYPGVHVTEIEEELHRRLDLALVIDAGRTMLPVERVDELVAPFLGGDDRVFGYLSNLTLPQWFDASKVEDARRQIADVTEGVVVVIGCGAWHVYAGDILIYADLPRWEAQNRFRRDEIGNLGADNLTDPTDLQYKRAFFVDWRVCDRWKKPLLDRWDLLLDTTVPGTPKLAEADTVRRGLQYCTTRPFRVVPFFDPAPWGGRWMKEVFGLDSDASNFGWCFDCVPEENSLLLKLGGEIVEIPSIDLVFYQPRELLGEAVHARFGDEFPIRFDLLDTMGGGNLSFQVHPVTEYIQEHFGMHYTQDESYYLLDAGPGAAVYLGLKEGVDREELERNLRLAQEGREAFDDQRYVNQWPAKKHDHFLIPAGTCHCSGVDSMVLEISATPYIFTFKMWDWGRLGLDGRPRPIHLQHGLNNVQWDRTTGWIQNRLINRIQPIASGPNWREESTGLDDREFIESLKHATECLC